MNTILDTIRLFLLLIVNGPLFAVFIALLLLAGVVFVLMASIAWTLGFVSTKNWSIPFAK